MCNSNLSRYGPSLIRSKTSLASSSTKIRPVDNGFEDRKSIPIFCVIFVLLLVRAQKFVRSPHRTKFFWSQFGGTGEARLVVFELTKGNQQIAFTFNVSFRASFVMAHVNVRLTLLRL